VVKAPRIQNKRDALYGLIIVLARAGCLFTALSTARKDACFIAMASAINFLLRKTSRQQKRLLLVLCIYLFDGIRFQKSFWKLLTTAALSDVDL
jgi:hypothetical protein